ncbi:MAG: N-acetylglucosamine-6-phosphate deacetylase [Vicinamibacterales bacterium]
MTVEFPGLVDIQVNGFGGTDFNMPGLAPDQIRDAVARLRETGVTRFLPTIITGPLDRFERCARALLAVDDPAIAGIHMEGPYISPIDGPRGAHAREHTAPASRDDFDRRQEAAAGRIALVTLAPEVPGALDLIEHLAAAGVRVAIGHSDAPPAMIHAAIQAGATLSTHLGNGCAATLPRHPNVIWEQLAADELWASIIVDGHHLPPSTVKAITRAKAPGRTILVTDAIAAAGCPAGSYRIGDVDVEVGPDRRASLRGTPYLAGSAVSMPEAIGHAVRFTGLPLAEVLKMASDVPSEYLHIPKAGTVRANWDADNFRLLVETVTGG